MDAGQKEASARAAATPSTPQGALTVYANAAEVLQEHKLKNTRYVIYRNEVYNVGAYLDGLGHPGGEAAIADYFGRDVTQAMHKQKHSKMAYKLLSNYKVGEVTEKVEYAVDKTPAGTNSLLAGHSLIDENLANRLAKRFDLNKPIFTQILDPTLTLEEYLGFITEPKVLMEEGRQIRIFESDFFEAFSSTKWYAVPLVWCPVIVLFLTLAWQHRPDGYTPFRAIAWFLYGIFHWTITEYVLHRFLFHIDDKLPGNGWVFGLHFLIHGIHHAFPQDPGRLVFPIFNALVVGLMKMFFLLAIFGSPAGFFVLGGWGVSYILYDLFHYYSHHSRASLFDEMRRYHMRHHHKNPSRGFGVTSKLWDYVFGTVLEES